MKKADTLEQVDVRKEDVLQILKNMRIEKSPGPHRICPRLLREAREEKVW